MLILYFSTGWQIFYVGDGLIFYWDSTTKACVTAADPIDSDGNMHSFMRTMSCRDIKISFVSQCRIFLVVQYMKTQLFTFWITLWQSYVTVVCALLTCVQSQNGREIYTSWHWCKSHSSAARMMSETLSVVSWAMPTYWDMSWLNCSWNFFAQ